MQILDVHGTYFRMAVKSLCMSGVYDVSLLQHASSSVGALASESVSLSNVYIAVGICTG